MGSIRPGRAMRLLWLTAVAATVAACSSAPPATPSLAPGGQPSVAIESPANGSPTTVGQPLTVQARAEDAGDGVNRIDLRVGGILVDSETTPGLVAQQVFSASLEYSPSADGAVTLSVTAHRPDGTASTPAEITVAVMLPGESAPPIATATAAPTATSIAVSPTPAPAATPAVTSGAAPAVTPTAAARPTLPPFATPTPRPSPSPTPTPTAIDVGIAIGDAPPPTLEAGTEYTFSVSISNSGPGTAPPLVLRARLCNPSGGCGQGDDREEVAVGELAEGSSADYEISVTPEIAGQRELRFRLVLPAGYADPTPADLALDYTLEVLRPTPTP